MILAAPEITLMPMSLFICYILPHSAAVLNVPFSVISLESLVNSLHLLLFLSQKQLSFKNLIPEIGIA